MTSRSFGVQRVSLKSQQSIGLMAPPSSMKMQLRAVPRGLDDAGGADVERPHQAVDPRAGERDAAPLQHVTPRRNAGRQSSHAVPHSGFRASAALLNDEELGTVDERPQQVLGAAGAILTRSPRARPAPPPSLGRRASVLR